MKQPSTFISAPYGFLMRFFLSGLACLAGCGDGRPAREAGRGTAVLQSRTDPVATDKDQNNAPDRLVIDSRGRKVTVPARLQRVATVSDGLVEEVMLHLGVEESLVGIGSTCLIRNFKYEFETASGEILSYADGMNPALYLYPRLTTLPLFVRPGTEINFETLAGLDPDLLILDLGACTLSWRNDPRAMQQGLDRLQALGIPTVVLMGPNAGGDPGIAGLSAVVRILGQVFDRAGETGQLVEFLEASVQSVAERTRAVAETQRRSVLLLGLNPRVREGGGIGQAFGTSDIQSYFVEEIVRGTNAYRNRHSAILNLEQVLELNPEVIILPTANGYHPPRELTDLAYFRNLEPLEAVRRRRVAALPWSPCNCDKRLEYPLDVMVIGKTVYPELFGDIDLAEWILEFYRRVYGVDREKALGLLKAQWLDWTLESSATRIE